MGKPKIGALYVRMQSGPMVDAHGYLYKYVGKYNAAGRTHSFTSVATGRECRCFIEYMRPVEEQEKRDE